MESVETDGVGLCIHMSQPVPFNAAAVLAAGVQPVVPPAKRKAKVTDKSPTSGRQEVMSLSDRWQRDYPDPVYVAEDRGRAKLTTVAFTDRATREPATFAYTRRQYYWEIGQTKWKRWVEERSRQLGLKCIHDALSETGGIRNPDTSNWIAYMRVWESNWPALQADHIADKQRALWRMRLYRWGRRAKDRLAQRIVSLGDTRRPLVLGTGSAGFACTGRGEQAAPTTSLDRHLVRAQLRTRRPILRLAIDEFKTTRCCSVCGCETIALQVACPDKELSSCESCPGKGMTRSVKRCRASRRLRMCEQCLLQGEDFSSKITCVKPGVYDRDIQACRNMLWLTMYMYLGVPRPEYMSRPGASKEPRGQKVSPSERSSARTPSSPAVSNSI